MASKVFPIKKFEKRAKKKLDDRRTIMVIFGLTLLASGAAYLKAEFPTVWRGWNSPMVISTLPKERSFNPTPALDKIQNLTKNLRGRYGVDVYQLTGDKNEYGFNQNEVFPAASLMKLPVILTLYQQAEAGRLNLMTKYSLKESDKIGGAGILQTKPAGSTYTYRRLAKYMGHYSDNTAYHVLVRILGSEKIQQVIDKAGMNKTSLKRHETTPADMALFFRKLYQGKLVNQKDSFEIMSFLTKTVFEDWIPAGVPENVRVVHKIGRDLGTFSDAGIVFAPHPFVLVVMSKEARASEAVKVLPKISRVVWEFETGSSF